MRAAAARTSRIRLGSAVAVLSAADPVRVFQQFATLDLISKGRVDLVVGRGSFVEAFPLFGLDLADYDELFEEKLDLLLRLRESEHVTWSGRHRPALTGQGVYPRPLQDPLPIWVGVGGTPESFVRAGLLGLPLMVAIIGGQPRQFAPLIDLYRRAGAQAGHPPEVLKVGLHVFGFVAESTQAAADTIYPGWHEMFSAVSRERGFAPPSRAQFDASLDLHGSSVIGSPEQVIEKILFQHEIFRHKRFLIQFSVGTLPHAGIMRSIELFGTEVAPVVRREVERRTAAAGASAAA